MTVVSLMDPRTRCTRSPSRARLCAPTPTPTRPCARDIVVVVTDVVVAPGALDVAARAEQGRALGERHGLRLGVGGCWLRALYSELKYVTSARRATVGAREMNKQCASVTRIVCMRQGARRGCLCDRRRRADGAAGRRATGRRRRLAARWYHWRVGCARARHRRRDYGG
jgi:hypothetical protein